MRADDLEDRLNANPSRGPRLLQRLGADRVRLPGAYWVLRDSRNSWLIEFNSNQWTVQDAVEWIYAADLDALYPNADEEFNTDFWSSPAFLYHNTDSVKLPNIKRYGLRLMNDSRGIANRGTGAAIFTTWDLEQACNHYYGDLIVRIDTAAMKVAGYTPFVSEETPCREYEQYNALAHLLGVEVEFDLESGIAHDTIIVFSPIPPQYLKYCYNRN